MALGIDFARTRTLSTVTRLIRDRSPISRSAIVAETSLTHAAVSRAVSELQERGVVVEKRYADESGPRRKHGLQFNGDHCYALGIEYSRDSLRAAALDLAGVRRITRELLLDVAALPRDERLGTISNFCASFLRAAEKALPGQCVGAGIVDPGIVDRVHGVTIRSSLLDDWCDVPIADLLTSRLGLPVRVLNSGMARLKAVDRLELPKPSADLLFVEYGEGIGCGLKLENRYVAGSSNLAGEMGHMKMFGETRPCRCGGAGCLEAVAALPAVARTCREALTAGTGSVLAGAAAVDGRAVLEAAARHDILASRVVAGAFELLATAIAGIISVSNPRVLVLDSTIVLAGEQMCDHLVRATRDRVLPDQWKVLEVRFSTFDSFIGPVGGAVDLFDSLLE